MEESKDKTAGAASQNDDAPGVTGIGGIFFFSDNPKETKDWYAKNLGFKVNEWGGVSFNYRNIDNPNEVTASMEPF